MALGACSAPRTPSVQAVAEGGGEDAADHGHVESAPLGNTPLTPFNVVLLLLMFGGVAFVARFARPGVHEPVHTPGP